MTEESVSSYSAEDSGDVSLSTSISPTAASSSSAAPAPATAPFRFSELSLEEVRSIHRSFSAERDWEQFHTPRNLLLALVGEVGELSEILQWKGELAEGAGELNPSERQNLADEIADCMLYLTAFAGQYSQ